jgi:histidinol dehydrogenase
MAYGTETIPRVYKIFGPGNQYVTCAKQIVSSDVAIDMPAGPSEVAVLADQSCVPSFVASDLLSQAEHGPDSQVILVAASENVIIETLAEIEKQIIDLPRRSIAERSIANSKAILARDLDEGIEMLNEYAAEHLILAVQDSDAVADKIRNAGSVFLGNYSCESAGDYASGTNHTLPTAGFARSFSGVSLDSFVKKITFQKLTVEGIRNLGPAVETLAAAEGLDAHKRAISIRLEEINEI